MRAPSRRALIIKHTQTQQQGRAERKPERLIVPLHVVKHNHKHKACKAGEQGGVVGASLDSQTLSVPG